MATPDDLITVHGSPAPLQELITLRAGPVTAVLDGVDLRYVRLGEVELVRRIYVGVRDRNWNTIPGVASAVHVAHREDGFEVAFSVHHASHDIAFAWRGSITGGPDGRIRFAMDGEGERTMLFNRIGFCVLHPWRESAGRPYRGRTPGGDVQGVLPDLVAPQGFADGAYVPLFESVSRLEIDLKAGGAVVLEFVGDLFETEDQRNWTDASLKTYCTPLALGFPRELRDGERRAQAVTVSPRGFATTPPAPGSRPARAGESRRAGPRVGVGAPTGVAMPVVGLGLPAGAPVPSVSETARLRVLGPAHLRHEVHLGAPWREELDAAASAAAALGARLEVALFTAAGGEDLAAIGAALAGLDPARVLVAVADAQTTTPQETTPGDLVARVRTALGLGAGVPVAGGTDMYFCELNRTRPDVERMDGVFWSMNPQVHAFDDLSVMETPEAQGEQVRTARAFAAALGGGEVMACTSDRPLEVAGLAVAPREGGLTVLLANLTPRATIVAVDGIDGAARLRRLNIDTGDQAMLDPERFRASAAREAVDEIGLGPYETVRIDTPW